MYQLIKLHNQLIHLLCGFSHNSTKRKQQKKKRIWLKCMINQYSREWMLVIRLKILHENKMKRKNHQQNIIRMARASIDPYVLSSFIETWLYQYNWIDSMCIHFFPPTYPLYTFVVVFNLYCKYFPFSVFVFYSSLPFSDVHSHF